MPQRVVFDTNVIISGLMWRGKAHRCTLLARTDAVQMVYCPEMLAELSLKLREKFGFSENRIHAVLYDYRQFSERVKIIGQLKVVSADPDDDKFIECALVGNASVIVSSDKHLTDLKTYQSIVIVRPDQFLAMFGS
ncbi:MAG: putative toxin-antitoxin system toxin component, PIN family [Caldilineales bacterium]|nr:putative toxin-antitoxin system toxin component, PIN family [Caldilineales bacterium]